MKFSLIIIVTFLLGLASCSKTKKPIQNDIIIDDYSVEITFSSFGDCGDFKKYILNNLRDGDPSIKRIILPFNLYEINIKGNCDSKTYMDTITTALSKLQSDSLFDLSNIFIDNFKLINRVKPYQTFEVVYDGANVKIEICLMNKCKSATYYHYAHLLKISPEMRSLIEYIDFLTKVDSTKQTNK